MTNDRLYAISEEVHAFAFQLLDAEPEVDAMDAGRIAGLTQIAFWREATNLYGDCPPTPNTSPATPRMV